MASTSAIAIKRYLVQKLETLMADYTKAVIVKYGPPAGDVQKNMVIVGDVQWSESEHSSHGARRNVWEVYNIDCHLLIVQRNGTCEDVDMTAEDLFEIAYEDLRDDFSLGGNVQSVEVHPSALATYSGAQGGSVAVFSFNVTCKKQLR